MSFAFDALFKGASSITLGILTQWEMEEDDTVEITGTVQQGEALRTTQASLNPIYQV